MTTLYTDQTKIPAATLGPWSPLPPITPNTQITLPLAEDIPEAYRERYGYGFVTSPLPYTNLDGYDRSRTPTHIPSLVLENAYLKATFWPTLGGRMQSLFDKKGQRELLYVNKIFQPGNLSAANAWFAGGVEWNCGAPGHSPLTCSPLFAARVDSPEGWPALRMWEFDRIRACVFQMDFILPPDSPCLYVHVRIINSHAEGVPMYWWTNIALESPLGTRVIVPATRAFNYKYGSGIRMIHVPEHDGVDLSYAEHVDHSVDYFYNIPPEQMPWEAAVDADGKGLLHLSTHEERGRKLFAWGEGTGGRNWQDWLGLPGDRYIEIQAGIAATQYESFHLPAHTEISWMEGYAALEVDANKAHADWSTARKCVDEVRERLCPDTSLETERQQFQAIVTAPPAEILQTGSGWGALEAIRREHSGEAPLAPASVVFPSSTIGAMQTPWLTLLESNHMPDDGEVMSWMTQKPWQDMLESIPEKNAQEWLQLGIMRHVTCDEAGAIAATRASLEKARTTLALRNLAAMLQCSQDPACQDEIVALLAEACPVEIPFPALHCEYLTALLASERAEEALNHWHALPQTLRTHGRIRLLAAKAAMLAGAFDEAEQLLGADLVVPDIREGERLLSDTWHELQARKEAARKNIAVDEACRAYAHKLDLPKHLDFRQAVG